MSVCFCNFTEIDLNFLSFLDFWVASFICQRSISFAALKKMDQTHKLSEFVMAQMKCLRCKHSIFCGLTHHGRHPSLAKVDFCLNLFHLGGVFKYGGCLFAVNIKSTSWTTFLLCNFFNSREYMSKKHFK